MVSGDMDFEWDYKEEPHASRRKEILSKHPEIAELYGPDWRLKYVTTCLVLSQVVVLYLLRAASWPVIFGVAYCFGAVVNHALELAIHELSHNLYFKSHFANKAFSLFANLPMCIASAITFKAYHLEHHTYQGVDTVDMDIPSKWELKHVRGPLRKTLWLASQALWYALRPLFLRPKPPTRWELLNWVTVLAFDVAVVQVAGWRSLAYLLICDFAGLGLHPVAGHFIAEHYTFTKGAETYSYYGPLNWVNFWVGYHVEHHDFPFIPGTRLHRLREIAPEYYNNLPQVSSYVGVLWRYITDDSIGPWSRVKRPLTEKNNPDTNGTKAD